MKLREGAAIFSVAALLAACSGGAGTTAVAPKPEQGIFAAQSQNASSGKEVQVKLHSLATAGTIVTVIGELDYDTTRLQLKECAIDAANSAGKALHVAEPQPGVVRAVIAGTLEPLPSASDLLNCSFSVQPTSPAGSTTVQVHGEVADTTFQDRPFSTAATVQIGQ